jgi:peptide/nickel transport system substrate-binding protein
MNGRTNDWLRRRVSRRAGLRAGALGAGTAGLFLLACGGDEDNGGDSGQAQRGLITTTAQAATAKQPKTGGSLSFQVSSPPPSLDPYTQTSFLNAYVNGLTYSKLFRFKAGVPEIAPGDFTMEPDLAQNMGEQTDPTTMVVKLKQAKWHNVPPVNGRALTAEDISYAVDRYMTFDKSVHKSSYIWLDKLETPDAQTVVLKTKFPYADLNQITGGNLGSWISPKEHAESEQAATMMVGSGPFIHTEYQTGVSLSFRKNPDYYDAPFPYVDEVKTFIVTDTAKRVADFSAKSVDLSWLFLPDERDQLKRNRPDALFDEQQGIGGYIYLRADRPPFADKRVRQAISMGINRKALRDAITKGEGVPDQIVFVGLDGWARQVADLGAAAKYWEYNPAEAKKLLTAAGFEKIDTTWDHADAAVYTQAYVDTSTITQSQLKEIGVNIKDQQAPYSQYISTTYQGQYEGMGHSPRAVPYWMDYLTERLYWDEAKGPQGRGRINLSYVKNPQLNMLLDKQRGQFNVNERKATIQEIESICAEEQYEIYFSTDTRTYFWDPKVTNYRPTAWFPYTHLMRVWKEG